jgi:hypothetical protein
VVRLERIEDLAWNDKGKLEIQFQIKVRHRGRYSSGPKGRHAIAPPVRAGIRHSFGVVSAEGAAPTKPDDKHEFSVGPSGLGVE